MNDQVDVGEVVGAQPSTMRQRMIGRRGDHQPVATQRVTREREVGDGRAQQRDVDVASAQRIDLVGSEHLTAEGEVDTGQLLGQSA